VTGTDPLRVVVSAGCVTCRYALGLVAAVRRLRPRQPVEVIDLDDRGAVVPDGVFGTPTFLLGERIVSLGNPTLEDLLATLDGAGPG
jgi:2-hydroxychromene-2-carboxylate isomerase